MKTPAPVSPDFRPGVQPDLALATPLPAAGDDLPLELRGYVTQPQRAGYQLLTNYESTYWRAAVGNDAWSLYEVLRSYCHRGESECFPSINLLMATLGIRDRSVLVGRATPKRAGGKLYHYPGLLATLQAAGLVVVETSGERATQRYRFHVNLTPGLLSKAQVAQLPDLLRAKHAALLRQCRADWERLQARRAALTAPPAVPAPAVPAPAAGAPDAPPPPPAAPAPKPAPAPSRDDLPDAFIHPPAARRGGLGISDTPPAAPLGNSTPAAAGGMGNSHTPGMGNSSTPLGNSSPGYGKFPHKQQPNNNPQRTTPKQKSNNNTRAPKTRNSQEAVVVALTAQGLSEAVARRLAEQHGAAYIRKKIAYLKHLQDRQPDKLKNPRGWLRRAIEEDYAAPDGFGLTREQEEARRRHYIPAEFRDIIIG